MCLCEIRVQENRRCWKVWWVEIFYLVDLVMLTVYLSIQYFYFSLIYIFSNLAEDVTIRGNSMLMSCWLLALTSSPYRKLMSVMKWITSSFVLRRLQNLTSLFVYFSFMLREVVFGKFASRIDNMLLGYFSFIFTL